MRERQRAEIARNLLAERSFLSIADLMAATGASAASARRDAARLADAGLAERVHGGLQAREATFSPGPKASGSRSFDHSFAVNLAAKRAIARRAVALCQDGDVIIVNGGTTTYQMGEYLRRTRLKILTNSYPLAEFLIHETENRVALPGGEVYRDQKLIVAPFDDDAIQHYAAKWMFMSAISISPHGLIEGDPLIARAEAKLLKRADRLVVLADSSKFQVKGSLVVCPLSRVQTFITDAGAPETGLQMLKDAGVETIVVEPEKGGGMTETPPRLEVRDIEKTYPGVRALNGVSFDLRPGEVHALLGENGAGKSTLIKIMSGVVQPDKGVILVDGAPTRFAGPDDARRAGVATIYQELLLFPELSVAENIFLGHAPKGRFGRIDVTTMRERARALLDSLEIDDLDADETVGRLSVGNRQRVEILRALSLDARVLIMDEPTAALTEADVTRLFDIVRRLRGRGVGIVYISHRMDEIFLISDRVTVLRDGAFIGTRATPATNAGELVHMMVGRRIEALFPKVEAPLGAAVLEARDLVAKPMTRGVSLSVRAGEIVGLGGLVGSGRSELAQVLFGVTPAESGEIRLNGQPVSIRSPAEARALGVAYVPEDRGTQGLVRPMSVKHNFSLAGLNRLTRFGFIDRAAERRLAEDAIKQFGVKTRSLDEMAGRLSGGNQQKIVLGKWLANHPRLLILDEPTRGIDVGAKAEIHRLMGVLANQGVAILMISSELPEVLGMSDRVLVMREGRIVAEFARADASSAAVGAAMMGDADGRGRAA